MSKTDKIFDNVSSYSIPIEKLPNQSEYQFVLEEYVYDYNKKQSTLQKGEMAIITNKNHANYICTNPVGKILHVNSEGKNNFVVVEIYNPYKLTYSEVKVPKCKVQKVSKLYGVALTPQNKNDLISNQFKEILKEIVSSCSKFIVSNIFNHIDSIQISKLKIREYLSIFSKCIEKPFVVSNSNSSKRKSRKEDKHTSIFLANYMNDNINIPITIESLLSKCKSISDYEFLLKYCDSIVRKIPKIGDENILFKESFHPMLSQNYYFKV